MGSIAFGNFLCTLREESGLSQAELACRAGTTEKRVARWENGRAMPRARVLKKLAALFGVTEDEMLTGSRFPEHGKQAVEARRNGCEQFRRLKERERKQWIRLILAAAFLPLVLITAVNLVNCFVLHSCLPETAGQAILHCLGVYVFLISSDTVALMIYRIGRAIKYTFFLRSDEFVCAGYGSAGKTVVHVLSFAPIALALFVVLVGFGEEQSVEFYGVLLTIYILCLIVHYATSNSQTAFLLLGKDGFFINGFNGEFVPYENVQITVRHPENAALNSDSAPVQLLIKEGKRTFRASVAGRSAMRALELLPDADNSLQQAKQEEEKLEKLDKLPFPIPLCITFAIGITVALCGFVLYCSHSAGKNPDANPGTPLTSSAVITGNSQIYKADNGNLFLLSQDDCVLNIYDTNDKLRCSYRFPNPDDGSSDLLIFRDTVIVGVNRSSAYYQYDTNGTYQGHLAQTNDSDDSDDSDGFLTFSLYGADNTRKMTFRVPSEGFYTVEGFSDSELYYSRYIGNETAVYKTDGTTSERVTLKNIDTAQGYYTSFNRLYAPDGTVMASSGLWPYLRTVPMAGWWIGLFGMMLTGIPYNIWRRIQYRKYSNHKAKSRQER